MRITLDAAILVRAHAFSTGPAKALLEIIFSKKKELYISEYILAEVERVLHYPRLQNQYGLSSQTIARYVSDLRNSSILTVPAQGPRIIPQDPNDDPILYTAVAANADVLCTVDQHFFEPSVLAYCARRGIAVKSSAVLN